MLRSAYILTTAERHFDLLLNFGMLAAASMHRDLSIRALRENLTLNLLARPGAAIILCSASLFGVMAMALSQFITTPYQMTLALRFARRHVAFAWSDLWRELVRSAFVTVVTIAMPLSVVVWHGGFALPFSLAIGVVVMAAAGWMAGLVLAQHAFLAEVRTFKPDHRPAVETPDRVALWTQAALPSPAPGGLSD